MTRPTMLVTAAAGNTGYPTARALLASGHRVRAMVRRAGPRAEALRSLGAEVVVGSLDDIGDVEAALTGVHRAYFCPPLLPGLLDKAALFAAAAQEQRVEFVVALSQWLADPGHGSIHTRQSWLAERLFAQLGGVGSAVVSPGWFADNYLAAPDLISQFGLLPLPLGEGLNAPPSNEDIGAVVAAILADPAAHAGRTYRPTGPAQLSPQEIVAAFSRVMGRPVRYVNTPISLFGKVARSLGLPDYTTAQVMHYLADYQRNAFGIGGPTGVVPELLGRPAEDLETIAARYLSPVRTARTRLVAGARLARGLLRGTADLHVISRTRDFDLPNGATATDSPRWRLTHAPSPAVG